MTEQTTISFVVRGPIARPDLPGLCDRLCDLIAVHEATCAVCDVGGLEPDAVTVDALARLQLAARRCGCALGFGARRDELSDLVTFVGLQEVLLG